MESQLVPLHRFYLDQEIYKAVYEHVLNHLKDMAIEKSFAGEPTNGLKEAKVVLENSFNQIEKKYKPKEERKVTSAE